MKVLVACEFSGRVRSAFRALGHDAWSCDLLPADDFSPYHIKGDVTPVLDEGWDLIIGHPPCTYLTNSGVCHLHTKTGRWDAMREGCRFFNRILQAKCPKICVENPIPHKYAKAHLAENYSQKIQPWMFGHPESKATCLWLKNLPQLQATKNVRSLMDSLPVRDRQRLHYLPPSPLRWKLRSETFLGVAEAMAEQWGETL